MKRQEMSICLWFDHHAEEAVQFYTSVFQDSKTGRISRFGKEGFEHHGKPEGSVMAIDFELNGMHFIALNGGPEFTFNESISVVINCETQEEIDHYWSGLCDGGQEGPCGWLKDRFGISWQVNPSVLPQYLTDPDPEKRKRVGEAIFRMKKLDIETLKKAYEGTT